MTNKEENTIKENAIKGNKNLHETHPDRLLSVNVDLYKNNKKQSVKAVIEEAISKGYTILPADGSVNQDGHSTQGIVLFKDVDGGELAYNIMWKFGDFKICTLDFLNGCGVVCKDKNNSIEPMIYIVTGETGEYEDFTCWNVKAFEDKKQAEEFVEQCNKFLQDNNIPTDNIYELYIELKDEVAERSPDKNFNKKFQGQGVLYQIEEVNFIKKD